MGFDNQFLPPFPFFIISISNIRKLKQIQVKGFIDYGSDGTAIPSSICLDLDLFEFKVGEIMAGGINSPLKERVIYGARLMAAEKEILVGVDCRNDIDFVLLGRDFLNYFKVLIDGMNQEVEFHI